jgi:serine/threonine-protein kinase RsbW
LFWRLSSCITPLSKEYGEVQSKLHVKSKMENLTTICDFVTSAAEGFGLDEDQTFAVQMAVDEACTNVIEHAYGGSPYGTIDITCKVHDDEMVIQVRDHGKAFDPKAALPPDLDAPLGEPEGRCLGLYLMFKLMDSVRFEFDAIEGNTLTMVKRIHSAKPATCA